MSERTTHVRTELNGPCAIVTIGDGSRAVNLLDLDTLEELHATVSVLNHDTQLRAAILTGAGRGSFVAGADLRQVGALDRETALPFSRLGQSLMVRIAASHLVFIAAVDGACMGGGFDLFLACDLRYATPDSRFRHPGALIGIITGWGGTAFLRREIGVGATGALLNSAGELSAREAERQGLLNGIVPADTLLETCIARAIETARVPIGHIVAWKRAQRITS